MMSRFSEQDFDELAAWLTRDAAMHATWSPRIAPVVREIYSYWLPYRIAVHARTENARRH